MDLGIGVDQFSPENSGELAVLATSHPLTSADFLIAALRQANVGTWQVDLLTGIFTWDAVASQLLGLPAEPITTDELLSVHPDDKDKVRERFEHHAAVGGSDGIEFRIYCPDGTLRWLQATGRRIDVEGEPSRHLVGIVTDITEQKVAAQSLQEAEERYRLISQVTTDIIFDWDIKNDHIRWNEAKGAFFGYSSNDLGSMGHLRHKIHPDDQDRVVEEFTQAFGSLKTNYASDHRLQNSEGTYLDIHACGTIIRDDSGQPIRLVGSIQDVSERRYADAALRESEAVNRGIVEASTDSVVLVDLEGRLLFMNNRGGLTKTTRDYSPHYGALWASLWPESSHQQIAEAVKTAAAGGTAQITECFVYGGQRRWWDVVVSPIRNDAGDPIKLVAIARDITQRRNADDKLRRAATYDSLTNLPNRACFQDRLGQAVSALRTDGGRLGLLMLDVDDFKQVNDTLGHDAGDALLKSIAERLDIPSIRQRVVARLGGDEFAVLLEGIEDEAELGAHARAILARMKDPMIHAGRVLDCKVTIGAALFPEHGSTPEELQKSADIALYVAKEAERGAFKTFEHKHRDGLRTRAKMVSVARSALREGRLVPFYQPKVALCDRSIDGFEALLRWRHPTAGIQLPGTVAAAFEDLEVATAMSRTMLDLVIADMRDWLDRSLPFGHVAVNAGAAEFRDDGYGEGLLERLHRARIPTNRFQLEVTETVFFGPGAEYVERALRLLAREGVRIALDDFGTGYASLRQLKHFPVHVMKIDQGFVQGMGANAEDAAIIAAVINLGKSLRIDVVAEGIETIEQEAQLRDLGCEFGQGFLYSKAIPASSLPCLLTGNAFV
jgi:diguanylate cyclase (GGDEF)-like protein/PAS domain S-box-containing protein